MRSAGKRYAVCVLHMTDCAECADEDAGMFTRMDHGCASETVEHETDSLAAARMLGGKWAKRGYAVAVEDREDSETRWSL